jgi:hypothetical protein
VRLSRRTLSFFQKKGESASQPAHSLLFQKKRRECISAGALSPFFLNNSLYLPNGGGSSAAVHALFFPSSLPPSLPSFLPFFLIPLPSLNTGGAGERTGSTPTHLLYVCHFCLTTAAAAAAAVTVVFTLDLIFIIVVC